LLKNLKKNKYLVRGILIVMIAMLSGLLGWNMGYHEGTGVWPSSKVAQVVTPEVDAEVTGAQVRDFMAREGPTLRETYGEGFNCFESAVLFVRQAHWGGMPAGLMRISYGDVTDHAILAIFTTDEGWMFIDPQTGTYLKLQIGGDFCGHTITGLWWMKLIWEPVEWEDMP